MSEFTNGCVNPFTYLATRTGNGIVIIFESALIFEQILRIQ